MTPVQRAELIDRVAGEYVLGPMSARARRGLAARLRRDPELARAVARWQQRLLPLHDAQPPLQPAPRLWDRIAAQAFGPVPRPQRWWQRLLAPAPAGALALGLVLGSLAPALWQAQQPEAADSTQLPESYVGVLATAEGRPGLIVSSLRRGRLVDVKRVAAVPVPEGRTLYLWTLDAAGVPQPVGPLPQGAFVQVALPAPAEAAFQRAVELAVSLEPTGAAPAAPSGDYVYRGLCGKLWRVKPAP